MSKDEKELALQEKRSIVETMASNFNMEPVKFLKTIKATVIKSGANGKPVSDEELAAFLMIANEYKLNPFLKEIYAFPSRRGGIEPMVPIDGWISMVNRHKAFDGVEDEDILDDKGKLLAIKTTMYRKDRSRPISHTEYLDECMDNKKEPWRKWPHRMLGHKSYIQCARKAFGFTGIYDQDEIDRTESVKDVTPPQERIITPEFSIPSIDTERSVMVEPEVVDVTPEVVDEGTTIEEFESDKSLEESPFEDEPTPGVPQSELDTMVVTAKDLVDRIKTMANTFEHKNWMPKHLNEINALSADDQAAVIKAYTEKGEEINGTGEELSEGGYKALMDATENRGDLNDLWFNRIEKEVTDSKMKIRLRTFMNNKAGDFDGGK